MTVEEIVIVSVKRSNLDCRDTYKKTVGSSQRHTLPSRARGFVVAWFAKPLPRLRLEPGDGRRRGLFERREIRSRPICGTKSEGNKRQRGALLFVYFLAELVKSKVTLQEARSYVSDCSLKCSSFNIAITSSSSWFNF